MTSQERTGTLKLKKGGELSGTITESYNGDINITTYEGDMFVFQEKEVSKIIYDKVKTTKVSKHAFKGTLETSRISPKLKIEAPDKRWEHEITIDPIFGGMGDLGMTAIEYFANYRIKPWLVLGVGGGFGFAFDFYSNYTDTFIYIPLQSQIKFEFLRYSRLKPYFSIKVGTLILSSPFTMNGAIGAIYRINNNIQMQFGFALGSHVVLAPHIGTSFAF